MWPPGKSGAFGSQNGAVEKIHISIRGHPTSSVSLLLVVTLSMTMLGHSLPGGTSCPDFPPLCLWGLLVQLCQVSTPASLCGQPAQLPGDILSLWLSAWAPFLPGYPQCSGSFPGPQVDPWSSEMWAQLTKSGRSSAEQGQALCPRHLMPGSWPAQSRYLENSLT